MRPLSRRSFFRTSSACAVLGATLPAGPAAAAAAAPAAAPVEAPRPLSFTDDGLRLSPGEYARLLVTLEQAGQAAADIYLEGGAVAAMEQKFARALGKERALFLPSGTLANHLALRHLAGGRTRVIVPAESHIYCDSADCVQALSHLNLVPLGPGRATFTVQEVQAACERATSGPFPTPIGALSIECPVRRRDGEVFDFEELQRIAAYARQHDLKLHLDGARLFLAAAWTGIPPQSYAALFDTVYISLYKCFNAGSGAVLAGPKEHLEPISHDRKLFGGSLLHAWQFAAVAGHYLDGYWERSLRAVAVARELFALLGKHPRLRLESIPHGSNIHKLRVQGGNLEAYQAALKAQGVLLPRPSRDFPGFELRINESLCTESAPRLARLFTQALPA
jgi:threonine aldolase